MLQPIHNFIHRLGRLVLLDRAADPTANGEVQRNATHIKVFSGGAVRNLSDVGAAPAHTHASHTGIGTGDHHAQLHATAHQPAGGDAMAVDAAAATGSLRTLGTGAAQAATGNHTHAAAGAVTREGGDTVEVTTTSGTSVDLLDAAALTIATDEPFIIVVNSRTSAGTAGDNATGLKLNTTIVGEANGSATAVWRNNGGLTAAQGGGSWVLVAARDTLYLGGASGVYGRGDLANNGGALSGTVIENLMPNVEVTSVVMRALSNSSKTMGQDNLHIYVFASS